jgi:hypothetical protein
MRLVLAICALIAFCAPAAAAPTHRAKLPERKLHAVDTSPAAKGFAVPGWTDEQTQSWINDASGPRD